MLVYNLKIDQLFIKARIGRTTSRKTNFNRFFSAEKKIPSNWNRQLVAELADLSKFFETLSLENQQKYFAAHLDHHDPIKKSSAKFTLIPVHEGENEKCLSLSLRVNQGAFGFMYTLSQRLRQSDNALYLELRNAHLIGYLLDHCGFAAYINQPQRVALLKTLLLHPRLKYIHIRPYSANSTVDDFLV